MGQTTYFQRQPTLADLLLLQDNGASSSPAPQAPSAPEIYTPGSLTADQRQSLMDLAFGGTPQQEPTKPQGTGWQGILMSLADAASAYGSAYGRTQPTNFYSQYLARLTQQQNKQEDYNQRIQENKGRRATYLLGRDDAAKMAADEANARVQLQRENKAAIAEQRQADAEARAQIAAAAMAEKAQETASRERIAKMEVDARSRSDALQVELHKMRATGDFDKAQQDEYGKVRQYVITVKRDIEKALAEGKTTADQVMSDFQDRLDASDLSGTYRDAAQAFIQAHIGPIVAKYQQAVGQVPQDSVPTAGEYAVGQAVDQMLQGIKKSGVMQGISSALGPPRK